MLTVGKLKKILETTSDETLVIINNQTIQNAIIIKGRLSKDETYFGEKIFKLVDENKSNITTLQFEKYSELSDGKISLIRI